MMKIVRFEAVELRAGAATACGREKREERAVGEFGQVQSTTLTAGRTGFCSKDA
jgi:hypothetical protein